VNISISIKSPSTGSMGQNVQTHDERQHRVDYGAPAGCEQQDDDVSIGRKILRPLNIAVPHIWHTINAMKTVRG
ncbi:TPA: hypothetical protein ACP7Q5_004984, partial [Escherichia coli]